MATIIERDSFDPLPIGIMEDNTLHTPTRFLLNCFSEALTPSFGERYGFEEANPFEQSFKEEATVPEKKRHSADLKAQQTESGISSYPSPISQRSSTSSDEASLPPTPVRPTPNASKPTVFNSQGPENFEFPKGSRGSKCKTLKHKLSVDEDDEEDLEVKRLRFLERNRQAALKCRQKKKLWEKELQKYSDEVVQLNKSLRATVLQLKEEALMLKNQLLSHTDCDCTVVREYITKSNAFKIYSQPSYSQMAAEATHVISPGIVESFQASHELSQAVDYQLYTN